MSVRGDIPDIQYALLSGSPHFLGSTPAPARNGRAVTGTVRARSSGACARKHVAPLNACCGSSAANIPIWRRRRGDLCLAAGQIGLALVLVLVLVIVLVIVLALVLGPAVNLVSASRQLSPWKKITAGKFLITAKLVASPSEWTGTQMSYGQCTGLAHEDSPVSVL